MSFKAKRVVTGALASVTLLSLLACSGVMEQLGLGGDEVPAEIVVKEDPQAPPEAPVAPPAPEPPPPPVEPTPEVPVEAIAPPPVVTFEQAMVTCCSGKRASALVGEYLDVQEELQKGLERILGNGTALNGAARSARDDGSVSSEVRAAARRIAELVGPLRDAESERWREVWSEVSEQMRIVAREAPGGSHELAWVWCEDEDRGWLNEGPALADPYAPGSPPCGTFQRQLELKAVPILPRPGVKSASSSGGGGSAPPPKPTKK